MLSLTSDLYNIAIPPIATLHDLSRLSGRLDWSGELALTIDGSMLHLGLDALGLQAMTKQGLPIQGSLDIKDGAVNGLLTSKDPKAATNPYAAKWPDILAIAFRGSLTQKSIGADVTIRSTDWTYVHKANVCVDKAQMDKIDHFPRWVELMPICISLVGPGECPKFVRREGREADYPCSPSAR